MITEQTYTSIRTDREAGVLTITLNRPDSYNALNAELMRELLDALKAAARDDSVRCVVLTGEGKAFSSGQDLKEAQLDQTSVAETLRERYNPIARLIYTMEKPVLAAINGVAAGAGMSLALVCDMRIVADSANFRMAFSNVGLIPDCGACFTLPRLVGRGAALEMVYTGRAVQAEEALRLGMADRVVPAAELAQATAELARALAQRPTRALGLSKRAINRSLDLDLDDAMNYEALTQEIASATADFAEGVSAFREKRQPHFEGR